MTNAAHGSMEGAWMATIRIAVVEDEQEHAEILGQYLERFRMEHSLAMTVRLFRDGEDIIDPYTAEYDLIFLDIQLRFMNGMQTARKIREEDKKVILIFLTSMASYAIEGYEVQALDYILKPVAYDVFERKLEHAIGTIRTNDEYSVLLSLKDGVRRVSVSDIYYIESRSHMMIYHLKDGEVSLRGRLDDLEQELIPYGFIRSNRGYLINLYHVTEMRGDCCTVGSDKLPISRTKRAELRQELTKIL